MIHSSSSSSIGSSSQRSTSGGVSRSSRGSGSTTTDAPSTTSGSTRIASSQSRIVDQEDLHPNAAADLMLHWAALSRGLSGTRYKTLIINLPGSPGGVKDALAALDPIIDHAIAVLRGNVTEHASTESPVARRPPPEK